MEKMKMLSFIFYLFRNGSIKSIPLDFENRKTEILQINKLQKPIKKNNVYKQFRNKVIANRYTHSLIGTLAYLKNYKNINRQFFFIDSLHLCYIRIFKSASTSVLRQVLPIMAGINTKNINDKQVDVLSFDYRHHAIKATQKQYVYFTLIRNPFHRIVSVYLDLFDKENTFFSYQTYFFGILKKEMSFSEFVSVVSKIPSVLKSPHFASQYQIIKACGNLSGIKYFRIEKDQVAMESFLSAYDIKLEHSNKHKTLYEYYQYYDLNTLQLVYDMYKEDIEFFDYFTEYNLIAALFN